MTGYSTVRPGMESDSKHTSINQSNSGSTQYMNDSQQQESAAPAQASSNPVGTRIPGVNELNNPQNNMPISTPQSVVASNGKPIVGFLVSVSKCEQAEYWVLHQGQNTIGSSPESDIILSESSVSSTHAVLAIHRNPNESNKLNVGVIDRGSSNGTFVNTNYIGFNPYQCNNLDKIKIGNYEMLLMLFDYVEHDMAKSATFQATTASVAPAAATPSQQQSSESYDYADRDNYTPSADSTRY